MVASVRNLILLSISLVFVTSCGMGGDLRRPYVRDPRACPKANALLEDVVKHFKFSVPPTASNIKYYSDLHPMFGTYSLRLYFQLDGSKLPNFLQNGGFENSERIMEDDSTFELIPGCSLSISPLREVEVFDASTDEIVKSAVVRRTATSLLHVMVSAEDIDQ